MVGTIENVDTVLCEVHLLVETHRAPPLERPQQCVADSFCSRTLNSYRLSHALNGYQLSHACHAFCLFLKGRDGGMRLQKLQTS